MISGFNTDVPHREVVFHVQTEDKGAETAWIESLVYVGGRVIARKRVSYKAVLDHGGSKKDISGLMDRQHRTMIQGVREGLFDEEVAGQLGPAETEDGDVAVEATALKVSVAASPEPASVARSAPAPARPAARTPTPAVELAEEAVEEDAPTGSTATAASESAAPEPEKARSGVRSFGPAGSMTLDQVILDYMDTMSSQESLSMTMDVEGVLARGEAANLWVRVRSRRSKRDLEGVRVSVKVISTVSEPVSIGSGLTDGNGALELKIKIPSIGAGAAALIVKAEAKIGNAEIKHLL